MKAFTYLEDYKRKFKAELFFHPFTSRPCYRSLETKEEYKLFNFSVKEVNRLIKQSLKQGKDLLFEKCKDTPYSLEERKEDMEKAEEYTIAGLLLSGGFYN